MTIVNENSVIVVENLAVKNMVNNHNLAKAISDAALGNVLHHAQVHSRGRRKSLLRSR